MNTETHIIEKVVVEVNTTQEKTANVIKNNLNGFFKNEIFSKLEELLQKYDRPNTIFRIHELNLNVKVKSWENLKQVKYAILAALEEQLQKKIKTEEILIQQNQGEANLPHQTGRENLTGNKNEEEIFLFFLENGFLPWYGKMQQIEAFRNKKSWQNSFENPDFVHRLKNLLIKNDAVFVRLVYQFDVEMAVAFLTQINSRLTEAEARMVDTFKKLQPGLYLEFLHTLFLISTEKKNDRLISVIQHWMKLLQENERTLKNKGDDFVPNIGKILLRTVPGDLVSDVKFQQILNESLFLISNGKFPDDVYAILYKDREKLETYLTEKIKAKEKKERNFFENSVTEIAVQNAGLVLLHPFLKHFFILVKIIDKLGKVIPAKRELAVQTLHFLATGSEEFFEGNLVFEKFLCGLPLQMPIPRKSRLPREIKKEAEILLTEIIKNWPELKNTSPDGLRAMFLQRDGKLIQKNKNFKLIIERKTQDILLEKLSWNISVIKLNWLSEMLFVDW